MDIIALKGGTSCGKTTTLNMAHDKLISAGGTSTAKKPEGGDPKDFSDIVEWGGKKIAFFTMGDYAYAVIDAVRKYDAIPCDVLVCACNDKFVNPFKEFRKHPNNILVKVREANPALQHAANDTYANTIFGLL